MANSDYRLEAGDSRLFASYLRHRWRNPSNAVTNVVLVLSGFAETKHSEARHVNPGEGQENP